MSDEAIRSRFKEEVNVLINERISIGLICAALMIPVFTVIDQIIEHETVAVDLYPRLIMSLSCMLLYAINKTPTGRRFPFTLTVIGFTIFCLFKTWMLMPVNNDMSMLYLWGHMVLMAGAASFLPLALMRMSLIGLIAQITYVIPVLLITPNLDIETFLVYNVYFFSIWNLFALGSQLNYTLRYRSFILKNNLTKMRRWARHY